MDPTVSEEARELVLLYRNNDIGYARLEVGKAAVELEAPWRSPRAPRVSVNWPGCGSKSHAEAAAVAADLARASEIALATERLLSSEAL